MPRWAAIHRRLKGTREASRLHEWELYRTGQMRALGYSAFCRRYREWLAGQPAFSQLACRAGEWMLVDFWDYPVYPSDPLSPRFCVFVATLGASGYLFVESPDERTLATWVAAHEHAFSFYGGVPRAVVVLRLQPWASNPGWPRQELNPTYEEMARRYHTVILPPATFRPSPAAAVAAVLNEMSSLARNAVAASGGDRGRVRIAIQRSADELNRGEIAGWGVSRRDLYREAELGQLHSLP